MNKETYAIVCEACNRTLVVPLEMVKARVMCQACANKKLELEKKWKQVEKAVHL